MLYDNTNPRGATMIPTRLEIDRPYLMQVFNELAAIGRDPDGRGYRRLAWSNEERAAHRWFRQRAEELGFEVWTDHAGNSFADFAGSAAKSDPAVAIGSHLDTVPFGGAFDGGLGVAAALAAGKAIAQRGDALKRPLRLAAFTDEEGPRFGTGLLGSKALAGALDMALIRSAQDAEGVKLQEAMATCACDLESLPLVHNALSRFGGYLELHIEQGPRLERAQIAAAAVTAITGIRQIALTFRGKANHAGTTPKDERQNALRAAADTIVRFSQWIDRTDNLVANPGHIRVHPNAANVVPGETRLDWDVRSPDRALLDRAVEQLTLYAEEACEPFRMTVTHQIFHDVPPCPMSLDWIAATEEAASQIGLSMTRLVSWAGHDAGVLGHVIPAGMIFVPSRAGISHAPEEFSTDEAIWDGTRLLGQTALNLLTGKGVQ